MANKYHVLKVHKIQNQISKADFINFSFDHEIFSEDNTSFPPANSSEVNDT